MDLSLEAYEMQANLIGHNLEAADRYTLSIVVPVYNEEEVLPAFHQRLSKVLDGILAESEVIYINDGSTDGSLRILINIHAKDHRVAVVDLSRNFGKEIAMTAGIDHTSSDAVVVIDADLQDPPEVIPELIAGWKQGHDVVYAKRSTRSGESFLRRATAHVFYRLLQRISRVKIPEDTGDFRLLSRRAVDGLKQLREQHRYMKGLFSWIGYPQKAIVFQRDRRFSGNTKWNYLRLWNLAIEGITSFTIAPLKVATWLGVTVAGIALIYAIIIIYKTLVFGNPVQGYPSLMVVVLLLGGVQLVVLGVLGEYMGRAFNETKHRPLYLLNHYHRAGADEAAGRESP